MLENRWRRRLVRTGLALVVFVSIYAVLGNFWVPRLIRSELKEHVEGRLGLALTVGEIDVDPFFLSSTIRTLRIDEPDTGGPLVSFDELFIDFQSSSLFRRAWTFAEVRLVHPRLHVVRKADGSFNVERLVPPEDPAAPETPQLEIPRLLLRRLTIDRSEADVRDETRSPAFLTTFGPGSVEVTDFSTLPSENGQVRVQASFASGARLAIEGLVRANPPHAEGRVEVSEFSLPLAGDYFRDLLGITISEGTTAVWVDYSIDETAEGVIASVSDGEVRIDDLGVALRDTGAEVLRVPALRASGLRASWPARTAGVREVAIENLRARVVRRADGSLDVMAALSGQDGAEESKAAARPWALTLDALNLTSLALSFEDQTFAPPLATGVLNASLAMRALTLDEGGFFDTRFAGDVVTGGAVTLEGRAGFMPPRLEAQLDARALSLAITQSLLAEYAHLAIESGAVDVAGAVSYDETQGSNFRGRVTLADLEIEETISNTPLAGVRRLEARDARVRLGTVGQGASEALVPRISVPRVDVDGFSARIAIAADGSTNLARVFGKGGKREGGASRIRHGLDGSHHIAGVHVEVGDIHFAKGTVDFADLSLPLPFAAKIENLEGRMTELDSGGVAAKLEGKGTVDEYGLMRMSGRVDPFDPIGQSNLDIDFRNVEMSRLSPYSAAFAGYTIASGRLDMDLLYLITKGNLDSQNKIVIDQLQLGERVDAPDVPKLPVRLAVSLLKDRNGRIDLDVPVTGTVNDPEFNYRRVVWKAIVKILGNVAAAPFVALGRLFGIDGKDLEYIEFEPGLAELTPPTREKLEKLGRALAERQELVLEVHRAVRDDVDRPALARMRAQALVDARVADASASAASGASAPLLPTAQRRAALEVLVAEASSPADVDVIRVAHTTTVPVEAPPAPTPTTKPKRGEPAPVAPAPAVEERLDLSAYLEALFARLVVAQSISDDDVAAVADARAGAIAAFLQRSGGIDATRVSVVDKGRAKETDDAGVRVKLALESR